MAKEEFLRNLYLTSDSEQIVDGDRLARVVDSVNNGEGAHAEAQDRADAVPPDISFFLNRQ